MLTLRYDPDMCNWVKKLPTVRDNNVAMTHAGKAKLLLLLLHHFPQCLLTSALY